MSGVKGVCVLGATGSIGLNTLDVIRRHPERFSLVSVSGNSNVDKMIEVCVQFRPEYAVMVCEQSAEKLAQALKEREIGTVVHHGVAPLEEIAESEKVEIVMAAIVGAAGLKPNLAAVRAGKRVLLANKESLVMSGELFMRAAAESGAELLPIDSEHNAIFQSLPDDYRCGQNLPSDIKRLMLTASGGPFRSLGSAELSKVTPEQACRHPNWSMGQKISIDSATLMNKGLELIEACWLFNVTPDQVSVHVHPESIVHSMVEYCDGSVIAQMGNPDMRTPIAYGLAWPQRIDAGVESLNLFDIASLHFEKPDIDRFPCLALAKEAFERGGCACAVLNAANEVAVEAFLKGNIGFTDIPDIIAQVLRTLPNSTADSIEPVLIADEKSRQLAQQLVFNLAKAE